MDFLNQFDVTIIVDNAKAINGSNGTVIWTSTEKNVLLRYYRSGHGIGVMCSMDIDDRTMADEVLEALEHNLRIDLTTKKTRAGSGTVHLKNGSTIASDLAPSSSLFFYDTVEAANTFYAKDTYYRWMNGSGPQEAQFTTAFTVDSAFAAGGTNAISDASGVQGTYTNLITWTAAPADATNILHVAFVPATQSTASAGYVDGDVPGRLFVDLNQRTFKTTGSEGHPRNDMLRMLAKACVWLNNDMVPRSVLLYHTIGRRDESISPLQYNYQFYGMDFLVENYIRTVPHVDMGNRI